MRRRTFVQSSLCALLPLSSCSPRAPLEAERAPTAAPLPEPLQTVGLQLYTVRELLDADLVGTLSSIANLGYREVEFASYHGATPQQLKSTLDGLGLVSPAAHVSLDVFQNAFDPTLQSALALGHRHLILPFVPHEFRTPDGYRQVAAVLNDSAALAAPSGVEVGFHNHDFDFQALPGEPQLGFDILVSELDPSVRLELDTYWIAVAGQSPVEYFQRYAGRYRLCHVKDMDNLGAMADVGYGTLDWPSIIAAARGAGVEHFFVEHDQPSDALLSSQRSYAYLTGQAS